MNLAGRPIFRPSKPLFRFRRRTVRRSADQPALHAQKRSGAMVPNKPALGPTGERLNANTIAIISGNLNATYVTIAYDLSAVLDDRRRISACCR